jgi:hypothetical protein
MITGVRGLLEENGRGLLLAETLADRRGWQALARGKSVYVELTAWPATTARNPR